ncbi:MAG: hypothetical protein ABI397_02465 [Candidatus Saccharimonas sp.]
MSTKSIVMIGMTVGMTLGAFIPWIFGDHSLLDAWSIWGGLVGGFFGIWAGVKVAKQMR